MDAGEDREYSRQPRPEDLTKICAALNREGARYILIGGFAVIARALSARCGGEFFLDTLSIRAPAVRNYGERRIDPPPQEGSR